MNESEFKKWLDDASAILAIAGYSPKDSKIIIEWFRSMKGSDERLLIGNKAVNGHLIMVAASIGKLGKFDLYGSMMSRLFIYAPLILKEHSENI